MLEERGAAFRAALERVRGCHEIGVKVWRAQQDAVDAVPPASGGRAYLEHRRDERRRELDRAEERRREIEALHERLSACSLDAVVNRPQPPELTGRSEEMLYNAAFLVPADDTTLVHEIGRLQEDVGRSYVVEWTGPWPAHNFVEDEVDA
jgi:hypothetical protein